MSFLENVVTNLTEGKKSKWSELDLKEKVVVGVVVGVVGVVVAIFGVLTSWVLGFIPVVLPTFVTGGIIGAVFPLLILTMSLAVKLMLSEREGSVKKVIDNIILISVSFGIGGLLATTLGFTSPAAIAALSFLLVSIALAVVENFLPGKRKEQSQTVDEQESPNSNMVDNDLGNTGTKQSATVS